MMAACDSPAALIWATCVHASRNAAEGDGSAKSIVTGSSARYPLVISTDWESMVMLPGLSPSHFALIVMGPAASVERTETRLMPHSRSSQGLLIEWIFPLL